MESTSEMLCQCIMPQVHLYVCGRYDFLWVRETAQRVTEWLAPLSTIIPCVQIDNTALHHSAHEGHIEIVALLLEHGASVNLQNRVGVAHELKYCALSVYVVSSIPISMVSFGYKCTYREAVACSKQSRPTSTCLLVWRWTWSVLVLARLVGISTAKLRYNWPKLTITKSVYICSKRSGSSWYRQ